MKTKNHNDSDSTSTISSLTGAEEKFGRLFSFLQSGVAVFKRKGRGNTFLLQDLNESGERILALPKQEAFGKNLFDILGAPDPATLPALIHRVYMDAQPEELVCNAHPGGPHAPPLKTTFYKSSPKEIIAVFDVLPCSVQAGQPAEETGDWLTALFSQSHFLMVQLDTNFNYMRVSRAYAEANGRSPEFYIGRHFFDLYPGKGDVAFFRGVIRRGAPAFCFVRRHRPPSSPDGAEVFRNWDILPLKDGSGAVISLLVCMFDITGQFKATRLLGASEERFNSFFSNAPVGMGILDENLRYLKVNPTYADLNGLTADDYIGRHLSEIIPDLLPKVIAVLQQVIDTGLPIVNYEYSGSRTRAGDCDREGHFGHWVISVFPVHWGDKKGIGYIVVDITPLRRAEERLKTSETLLQSVFDGLSLPMIVMEKDRRVRYCNRAARDYYGFPGGEALGKFCHLGLKKESAPCEGCRAWEAIPKGVPVTIERKGLMNPDLIETVRIYPWVGAAGELAGAIMTISDETQTRLLERQIIQNQKLASIGLLVSGIAHEISNANNFVTFNIPLLRQYVKEILPFVETHAQAHPGFELLGMPMEGFCKDLFELVENLAYGSGRIKATVSALKDFSRIGTEEKISWMRLEQVVSKVVAICRSEITNRVKSFELTLPPSLPLMRFDGKALEQVLVNLVINAAHAADKETSWVKLRIQGGAVKGSTVTIEVSDNGMGMDKKTLERIFDPFFTTKAPGVGTGLGLYICQNLIEGMGGKIKVRSDPGEGTRVRVVLPVMETARP